MTKQSDLREELARLIDPEAWESGVATYLHTNGQTIADRILSRYDIVPPGSVVVPAKPTGAMITAAWAAGYSGSNELPSEHTIEEIYRAMLDARPGASHE